MVNDSSNPSERDFFSPSPPSCSASLLESPVTVNSDDDIFVDVGEDSVCGLTAGNVSLFPIDVEGSEWGGRINDNLVEFFLVLAKKYVSPVLH